MQHTIRITLIILSIAVVLFGLSVLPHVPYINLYPFLYKPVLWLGVVGIAIVLYYFELIPLSEQAYKLSKKYYKKWLKETNRIFSKKSLEQLSEKHVRIVLVVLFILCYFRIKDLYFQGDEWFFFKSYMEAVRSPWWFIQGLIRVVTHTQKLGFHLSPLLELIYVWTFRIFGLNHYLYLIVYSAVHVFNAFLMYKVAHIVTKEKLLAVIASLFFLLSASHHQAYTWISAAPGTTLAVTFSLLSLYYFFQFVDKKQIRFMHRSSFFLFLGLMTKEVALFLVLFIPFYYYFYVKKSFKQVRTDLKWLWAGIGFFLLLRIILVFKPWQISESGTDFQAVQAITTFLYRYMTFFLKAFSQTFIHQQAILDIAAWITEQQFAFFNAEKEVRGTTYLSFIQGPAFEFISYFMTVLILLITSLLKPTRKYVHIALLLMASAVLPIIAITYMFPWLAQSAVVDTRHLYHVSIGGSLLFALVVIGLAKIVSKWKGNVILVSCLLVFGWCFLQFGYIQNDLKALIVEANQRKIIISKLYETIPNPPEKMIIYTTSNKSYYGFGYWMLPFQSAFSHMLPVLFGKPYYANGVTYPQSFYAEGYLPEGGLVSQGYFEDDGYGLGYFLEETPLIKVLEEYNYSPEMVYAFDYDGDVYEMTNRTDEFRNELQEMLASREMFVTWERYGSEEDRLSFQAKPEWIVTENERIYSIKSQGTSILEIEVFENIENEQFSSFVGKQKIGNTNIGEDYVTYYIGNDLDSDHLIYSPTANESVLYTVAGNNYMFYKIIIHNEELAELIFRTFEFIDDDYDEISL